MPFSLSGSATYLKRALGPVADRATVHALYFAGLGCVVYGCWLIYKPAGWIIGGALLFLFSMLMDREAKDTRESR